MLENPKFELQLPKNPEALIQAEYLCRPADATDATAIQLVVERAIAARKCEPIPSSIIHPEYIRQHEEQLSKESTWSRDAHGRV
jgi:phage FluMu gp28-like protein